MSDFNIQFEEQDQSITLEFEQIGGGAVKSVNGKTGVVVLDADDVGAYTKPSGGIPKTDLASSVQTSLGKADSAYQKPSGGIPAGDIASDVVPAVDNTLTVSGAAADAKKTGDEISDLKDGLSEITVYSDDYTLLEPIKTVSGKYVFNNTYNNKLNEAADAGMAYKVFAVEAGQKYEVYGFGYDRYQFYMAVLGDNSEVMDGSTAVSNFIENVLCGTDAYPSGYTYHAVSKEFETNGYLFVNYKVAQSEATCSAAQKRAKVDTAITESVDVRGIEKRGNEYYHFSKLGDGYLIRRFANMGGNNLFQWAGIALGKLTSNGVSITQTIINYDTDIIGPIAIFNTVLFPNQYGEWSGGNHTKIVSNTAYPTAVQESLKVLVNGKEVTEDGVYCGDVKFVAVNSLYFPQSITGADLSTATKAITETREYSIGKQLHVRVRLNFVETVRVSIYYGMQAVIVPYNNILFANNEYYGALPNASNINFSNKEHEVIMTANDGMRLIASLRDIGLGTFNRNDGSTGYVTLPASSVTRKLYYRLIDGASSQGFSNGDVLMWEGCYSVDII